MGSSQSKIEPTVEKKLAERLQALDVKENKQDLEKGYVYIDDEKRTMEIRSVYDGMQLIAVQLHDTSPTLPRFLSARQKSGKNSSWRTPR